MGVGTGYVITADSTPVLDGWGWGDFWGPDHWILWHKKLKEKFGLDEANRRFITEYHNAGFGASNYDWRTFNDDFREYAKANEFFDALFNGLGGLLGRGTSVIVAGTKTAADTVETVIENTGATLKKTSNLLKWLIPVIIIVVVIAVIAGAVIYFKKTKLQS